MKNLPVNHIVQVGRESSYKFAFVTGMFQSKFETMTLDIDNLIAMAADAENPAMVAALLSLKEGMDSTVLNSKLILE